MVRPDLVVISMVPEEAEVLRRFIEAIVSVKPWSRHRKTSLSSASAPGEAPSVPSGSSAGASVET